MILCYLSSVIAMLQIIHSYKELETVYPIEELHHTKPKDTRDEKMLQLQHEDQVMKQVEAVTRIVTVEDDVISECTSCDVNFLQWTYKPPNGTLEDIVIRNYRIRTENQRNINPWFILTNNTNCTYNLLLPAIQFDAAGLYSCWENTTEITITSVIVISDNNKCFTEPEFPDPENIFLKQNDSITITCSFQYSADESCIVTPIWTDLTGYRNFMIPGDDFEVNMDDKHAWIHFKPGVKMKNGTQFNLSFAFNCSFTNITDKNQSGQYDFGISPFTLLIEVQKGSISEYYKFSAAVVWSLITAVIIAAVAVSLLVVCLKKYSKLCFRTKNRRGTSNETASEIAMEDRYF